MTENTRKMIQGKLKGVNFCLDAAGKDAKRYEDTDAAKETRLAIRTLTEVVEELLSYL